MHTGSRARMDYTLIIYATLILLFGLLMLSSASSAVRLTDQYFFIKRQLLFGFLPGLVACLVFLQVPLALWRRMSTVIFAGIIVSLFLVFIPGIGSDANTFSQSWIEIAGYSFQPAEFAKLGFIIFLAALIAKKGAAIRVWKEGLIPVVLMAGLPIFLIVLQPDVGTVLIFGLILVGMLFVAGARIAHLVALVAAGTLGVLLLALIMPSVQTRISDRLHTFTNKEASNTLASGYQISQAEIAIGMGGVLGQGYGKSLQKFQYLPEVQADSIFAIIAEEMGFIVTSGFILLLIVFYVRSLRIAKYAHDPFVKLLISGIVIWLMGQTFLNIGAIVGVLPLTGVPLPFVSHGGSALLSGMASIGIILRASRESV